MDINEFRKNYPQYNDLSDDQIADSLHKKYYADLPKDDIYKQLGLSDEIPTANIARAVASRGSQLMGNLFGAAGSAARAIDEKLGLGGIGLYDQWPYIRYLPQDEFEAEKAASGVEEPLTGAARFWNAQDFGYVPEHTWDKLKETFSEKGALSGSSWAEVGKYAAEQGIKSIPDMVAVVSSLPAYIASRSGEIGATRAQNKGKDQVEIEDVLEAAPFAIGSAILERIGAKGMTADVVESVGKEALKSGIKTVTRETGKGAGKEALTEFLQEGIIEYVGEKYGTDAQMSFMEALERGAAGAVAGGVYGGAVSGGVATGTELLKPGIQPEIDQEITPEIPPDIQPEIQPESELTLSDILNASDEEIDAMVDQYIAETEQTIAPEPAVEAQPETEPVITDRRTEPRGIDRRHDLATRKKVAEMSAQERSEALLTDEFTGLNSYRAFQEDVQDNPDTSVMYGDIDDFKAYNEKYGHSEVDNVVLPFIGDVQRQVANELGVKAFRRSGDEFLATGTPEQLQQYAAEVQNRLSDAVVEVELPDGTIVEHKGIGFSYGVDKNEKTAESRSDVQKQERKAAGLRVGARDTQSIFDETAARIEDQAGVQEVKSRKKPSGPVSSAPPVPRVIYTEEPELNPKYLFNNESLIVSKYEEGLGDYYPIGSFQSFGINDITDYKDAVNKVEDRQQPSQAEPKTGEQEGIDVPRESIEKGTLYANPIEPVYKAYQRTARRALDRVHNAWGWKMTPLGKLPNQKLYLKERYETLGKIGNTEEISRRIYETFRKLDGREAELVYEYLTTRDATTDKLSSKEIVYNWKGRKVTSTVKEQAEVVKKLIDKTGRNLVDAGLLNQESYKKYQDEYLPRLYLKHLLGQDALRMFVGGKKPSEMGYLKSRKDIPKDVREIILGEITDPGYLASKSIGRSMRDLAVLDWFSKIAQKPDWAIQDLLVNYKGQRVSIFWLKAESDRIKQQAAYYKKDQADRAYKMVREMDGIINEALKKVENKTLPKDFRQIPDTPQYGRLRGMYIRNEIYNDIVGMPGNRDPHAKWWQTPFEFGGIGTIITQLWKMLKVALNPPTQVRNFVSNMSLLQLSGVGSHRVLPLMIQSAQDIRQNGKHWRIAKKYGIAASTFSNNELIKIERALLDYKAKQKGKLSLAKIRNIAGIIGEGAGDLYKLSESLFKTAKIIDAMKREGKSESDAVLDAQKWLYDYSLVPPTVRYFRNTPIGVPFITFYYKTLPRMIEVLVTAPHRFIPYIAIPAAFTAWIASDYDVDPDDVEKLKMALPEWLRDHGHLFFLPYKDKHGRWQAFDFSYLLPWSMFEQAKNNLAEGNISEFVQTTGVIGGPVPDLVSAIRTNIDPFTKKEIVDTNDPPGEQVKAIMNYLWSLSAPTFLTDNGFLGKMYEAIYEVDKRTGEPKATINQAALRLLGMNIYAIEPEASRRRNMRFMQFEINEMQRRLSQRLRDKNLSLEDKRNIRNVYKEMIKEKRDQLKDYRELSKIHSNLKGKKPEKKKTGKETI